MVQRQLAAELEIDTPMYSKIKRGEQRAKRDQVIQLAQLLNTDKNELLAMWLAGQVYDLVKNEKVVQSALKMVENELI
jgi:transcriptional regulator with XRE-family HTH domain